ncbi:hypothetical protein [Absidia glauca]|uniref:Major facilitator superfamily (MFS) profile domain-containing protein n=1 Tax=Absidia glauca TaxID=4829 RepID=A0A163ITG9_ABSGL|nr:hypothetical protein [Absidia glauca]
MPTVILSGVDKLATKNHNNHDTTAIPHLLTDEHHGSTYTSMDEGYADDADDADDNLDSDEQPMLPQTSLEKPLNATAIRGHSLTMKILFLTLSLAGLQFTWSVEMAYGTPYLLSLGLSKSHMSLVWIAGPLSGLIMQPIAGAFSDKCTSRWGRRRPYLVVGSVMVIASLLVIGWTREITALFVDDSEMGAFKKVSIAIAITSIYVLDFSINCVQASCRALIVDSLPPSQQEKGTAWAGRMLGLGNVLGYFISKDETSHLKTFKDIAANLWNLPLPIRQICNVQFFAWIGWFPFLFYSTTWVAEIYDKTALQHPSTGSGSGDTVGQATRAGSLAFLVYSVVSLVASFFIPLLIKSSHHDNDGGRRHNLAEFKIRGRTFSPGKYVHHLQCLTLPRMWTISHFIFCIAMLSTILVGDVAAASIVIGVCGLSWAVTMWAPFSLLGEYISQCEQHQQQDQQSDTLGMLHHQARSSRISLSAGGAGIGASGGIYQLVEEEEDRALLDGQDDYIQMEPYRSDTTSGGHMTQHQHQQQDPDQQILVVPIEQPTTIITTPTPSSPPSLDSIQPVYQSQQVPSTLSTPAVSTIPSAGIILGIHNMYIVLPQFLVTFFSSVLFHFLEKDNTDAQDGTSSDAIGVVLRFGAVMAAIAGFLSIKLPGNHRLD